MHSPRDRSIVRDLARRYAEVSADPEMDRRRDLWRRHNSLEFTPPLIYVRAFAWNELPDAVCHCEDPLCRQYESFLRQQLYRAALADDSVLEPWVTVGAIHRCGGWGVSARRLAPDTPGGACAFEHPLRTPEDIARLRPPRHEIDERATTERLEQVQDLLGDLITVDLDRGPAYRMWTGDLSTDLGHLRGIEQFMLDMLDRPEWLHELLRFMSDGVLRAQTQAEAAGDWGLSAHQNQAMPYASELPDPAANHRGTARSRLWGYMAAQEFTAVSPAMHEEFLLRYQMPILAAFGLTAYGCCEDLTHKIDMLRRIPNLRRIGVAPAADVRRCVEQIGTDYVVSYRPSPADMVGYGYDPERVQRILRRDLEACRETHVDITLKDVETVGGDPQRVPRWVRDTRTVIDGLWS
jgi:hypothetical protein